MSDTEWIKKGKTRKSGLPKGGLDPKQKKKKLKTINVESGIEIFPLKSGGRAGFKVGGAAKRGISKILRKK